MHIIGKEEKLPASVIPSSVGRKHIVILPCIGRKTECSQIEFGLINKFPRLDKYGIREHVHIILESELLDLRIICSVAALNDLSVLVTHGSAIHKHGHRVLGVIIQMPGPQRIMILVGKLNHRTSELSEILIDQICKIVTREYRLILKDAHLSPRINNLCLHIPQCGITYEICIVM